MAGKPEPKHVGLPPRVFLYTLDQIATILSIEESHLKKAYCHFEGRSVGALRRDKLLTRNIAPEGEKPEWRVAEQELIRFLRTCGFRYHDRGWLVS